MRVFGPRPLPLDDRLGLDAALGDAFGPLLARRATVGPARVRAAVRWSAPEAPPYRGLAALARLSELAMAAAISAFMFGAAVASVAPAALPDVSRDAVAAGEWMLNGRNALQRPIDSRATDYRTVAGDLAANAVTIRRREAELPTPAVRDSEPFPHKP